MASQIIGRAPCPECGFKSAHIKESEKGTTYRYCPDCGAQYHAKNKAQAERLRAGMASTSAPTHTATATSSPPTGSGPSSKPTAAPAPMAAPEPLHTPAAPTPTAKPVRRGLFAL